jgi:hypothetical protein
VVRVVSASLRETDGQKQSLADSRRPGQLHCCPSHLATLARGRACQPSSSASGRALCLLKGARSQRVSTATLPSRLSAGAG